MPTKCYAPVRGSVIRVTRLDPAGNPLPGASAVVVSKKVSSITLSEETEEGTNIRERNMGDELCVVDDSATALIGYGVEALLCGVDPGLVSLLTGQPVVENAQGDIVGFDVTTSVVLDDVAYAIEIWSRLAGNPNNSNGDREWGYTLFPFIKGGVLGGFSFENAAVQFTITGGKTKDGNGWGVGPFDVDRDVAFAAAPLDTAVPSDAAFRSIIVSLDPPAATCGAVALAP